MADISLFAMVGRTDLRVVARDADDRLCLVEVDQRIGEFHDWLIANQEHLAVTASDQVQPATGARSPSKCRGSPELLPDGKELGHLSFKTERAELLTPVLNKHKLWLVSDKLGPLVKEIKEDKHTVRAIRIFDTHRTAGRFKAREPRAIGPLLVAWLNAQMPEAEVKLVSFLQGTEDALSSRDTAFNRGVSRIVESIGEVAQNRTSNETAWVADGGGPGLFKPALTAAAELHYAGKYLRRPMSEQDSVPQRELPGLDAADILRIRHRVDLLIGSGDYPGAVASANPVKATESERAWYSRLQALNKAMSSRLEPEAIAKLPSCASAAAGAAREFDEALDSFFSGPSCWLPAFLTECSLILDELPRAAIWTAAFYESALVGFVAASAAVKSVDPKTSESIFHNDPPEKLRQDVYGMVDGKPKNLGPCVRQRNGRFYMMTGLPYDKVWNDFIGNEAFTALHKSMRPEKGDRPFDQRNMVIHRCPSYGELRSMRQVFVASKLWLSKKDARKAPPGDHFIGRPIVSDALVALGVTQPQELFLSFGRNLSRMLRRMPLE